MVFVKVAPNKGPSSTAFAPRSPDGPPPSSAFAPRSPDGPPPTDSMEEDPALNRMLKIREIAIRMAGGDDLWDSLDEDETDLFMDRAEKEFDFDSYDT